MDIDPEDLRKSKSRWKMKDDGRNLRIYMEVKGLGVLMILTSSSVDDPKGRLIAEQCGLITLEELGPSPLPPVEPPPEL